MKNDFVHLHLHSQYSLLDGAIKFDELFDEVARQGMSAVALTDHGNLFGAYDFYKLGKKNNIKLTNIGIIIKDKGIYDDSMNVIKNLSSYDHFS